MAKTTTKRAFALQVSGFVKLEITIVSDFVCYPNLVSISDKGYIKITNLPFNTSTIDAIVYAVVGELVKSFNVNDLEGDMSINNKDDKVEFKESRRKACCSGRIFCSYKRRFVEIN